MNRTDEAHDGDYRLEVEANIFTRSTWLKTRQWRQALIALLLPLLSPNQALADLIWQPGQDSLMVDEYAYACEEQVPEQAIDPAKIRTELLKTQRGALNLGYLQHLSCWTEIQITLQDDAPHQVYLEHGLTQADIIRVFHRHQGTSWSDLGKAGNLYPIDIWPVHYRAPTFELKLQPGLNTLRIYQASRDITGIDWRIWEPKPFHVAVDWENILFGGFFAICFALSFYNLVIFVVSRDTLHLYYFFYLSTYGWVQMFMTGFTKLHLLTDVGPLLGRLGISSISISIFFVYLFVGKMLEIRSFPKLPNRFYWLMAFLSLSNLLLTTTGPFHIAAQNCLISSAFGAILAFIYGGYALKMRNPMAPIFMVAWILLLFGTLVQVSAVAGIVDNNPLTRSANFIGATVEAILISYALAFKMKRERIDETRRRKHAFSQLEKMVYPHQLSLMKEGRQLEETMPLTNGHACVICVDMVNSSKHSVEDLKTFLRSFFDECDALMNRGYIGVGLQAHGFRIKEMGDGFLCSIGFPFAPPSATNIRELALDMAFDFVNKFEETLQKQPLRGPTEPVLSIGIAEGPIEGFFTLSGIRSYELFGKGIVLATRYESLRKIYRIPGQGHLICIKTSVYEGLPQRYKQRFNRFGLDKSQQFIRDDEGAQDFYYQRIAGSWRSVRSA